MLPVNTCGKMVMVNGKNIALFFIDGHFYAVDEQCPHLGGYQGIAMYRCYCVVFVVVVVVLVLVLFVVVSCFLLLLLLLLFSFLLLLMTMYLLSSFPLPLRGL